MTRRGDTEKRVWSGSERVPKVIQYKNELQEDEEKGHIRDTQGDKSIISNLSLKTTKQF